MASDLMLLSNSFSPGLGPLEHAMDALAELLAGCQRVLFVGYASSEPDAYTDVMRTILCGLGPSIVAAHRSLDPCRALAAADAVFVGGGNAFRLLRAVQRNGLLAAIQSRVHAGMPYVGVSAGPNLACPTIRTTNDMPIVEPASLAALALIPFHTSASTSFSKRTTSLCSDYAKEHGCVCRTRGRNSAAPLPAGSSSCRSNARLVSVRRTA